MFFSSPKLPVPKYAFGMALWAAAELEFEIPERGARGS